MEVFIYIVVGAMLLIVVGMMVGIARFSRNIKSLEKSTGQKTYVKNVAANPAGRINTSAGLI